MLRVLVDVAVLAQGIKTGIFRVTHELVKNLLGNSDVELIFTLSKEDFFLGHGVNLRKGLKDYCAENNIEGRFVDVNVEPAFVGVDIYVSTFFNVPENWANENRVKKVVFAYDLIAIFHPEYFEEGLIKIVTDFYDHLKNDWLVISISEYTKKDLLRYRPDLKSENIDVIYLAAEDKFGFNYSRRKLEEIKKKYNIPLDKKIVLSVATLEIRKNLLSVIEGYSAYLKQSHDEESCLVLTGMQGWKLEQLTSEIEKREELNSRVILTGFVDEDDLPGLYAGASAFVYMSFYEGFGLPPLEAMKSGLPVITSDTSSLPEVVGNEAITLQPDDISGLARELDRVLSDKSCWEKYSQHSKKRAEKFSWEKFGKSFYRSIRKLELSESPFLSIITICLNEKHIEDTCRSIANQTYNKFEWIVVDGGSSTEALASLNSFKDKMSVFLSESDEGRYDAMNKGIIASKGKYILFLNGGDYLVSPDTLKNIFNQSIPFYLLDYYSLTLNAPIVYGEVVAKETGFFPFPLWKTGPQVHDKKFFSSSSLPHQATFIKKELFDEFGLYNVDLKFAADYEWFMRVILYYNVSSQYIPVPVSVYNFEGVSSSSIEADAPHIKEAQSTFNHYKDTPENVWGEVNEADNVVPLIENENITCNVCNKSSALAYKYSDISYVKNIVGLAQERLSIPEVLDLLFKVELAIKGEYYLIDDVSPGAFSKNNAFNLLSTYVSIVGKKVSGKITATAKVPFLKCLHYLRGCLFVKRCADGNGEPFPALNKSSGQSGKAAIINGYMCFLGRKPSFIELNDRLESLKGEFDISSFHAEMRTSIEAQKYEGVKEQFYEFAKELNHKVPPEISMSKYQMAHRSLRYLAIERKFKR